MTAERWVILEPLDTLVVRDGRAFDAGLQSVARTTAPSPATLAGAIGAAYGARPGAGLDPAARGRDLPERLLGPVHVLRRGGLWRARWPMPLDVVRDDEDPGPSRLTVTWPSSEPPSADLSTDLDEQLAAFPAGQGRPVDGWWETAELAGYLADGIVTGDEVSPPWAIERRVGLSLQEDGTAAEGMLYSAEHLRPGEATGFAMLCLGGPEPELPGTVPLGGRSRLAQVHQAAAPPDVPGPASRAPDGRLLIYLATPAVFAHGWRPDLTAWPHAELIAAVTGRTQVIATATPDRSAGTVGAGQLMWAVPAGSVYYLKFADEQSALAAAGKLHRQPLPQATEPLATAGFGFALTGSW
jgi:CRISPR/Cas system CMR-associated protein Cmr3 (group 5 of RAMP superfamily)